MMGSSNRKEVVAIGVWGNWKLDFDEELLVHAPSKYLVDFRKFDTTAGMLDTIFQVRGKDFILAQDVGDFIDALFDLFDPQENLCTIGQEKPFNADEYFRKLIGRAIPDGPI